MLGKARTPSPTDLEILGEIYESYYDEFERYVKEDAGRDSKICVPLDLDAVAEQLGVDTDIVFGRLYYDLEQGYGYQQDNGAKVHFLGLQVGGDSHCVNFPYLASVVARLRDKREKHHIATGISILSLVVAVVSVFISLTSSGAGV